MRKHLIFMLATGSTCLLAVSSAIGLIAHGRSFRFAFVWMILLALSPLYVITDWISKKIEKEGYLESNRRNRS